MRTLTPKHIFLAALLASFGKFFFHSSYLEVILIVSFSCFYFLEEFKVYQKLGQKNKEEVDALRLEINKVLDNQRHINDKVNEVRSAASVGRAMAR